MQNQIEVLGSIDVKSGTSKGTGAPYVITNFKGKWLGEDDVNNFTTGGDRKDFLERAIGEQKPVRVIESTHNMQYNQWRVKLDIPKFARQAQQIQVKPQQTMSRGEYDEVLDQAFVSVLKTVLKPSVAFIESKVESEDARREVIVACLPTVLECAEKLTAQYMISIQNGLIDLSKKTDAQNGADKEEGNG